MTAQPAESEEGRTGDLVRQRVAQIQEILTAALPEAKFRLEQGQDATIWHFSIYAGEGRLFLPLEVTQELNRMWLEHKISVITTVYSIQAYQEKD